MRKRDLERCRTLLLEQRERILGNEGRVLSGELDVDPDDFPDEIDTAVAESSLSFTEQIWERERRLLNKPATEEREQAAKNGDRDAQRVHAGWILAVPRARRKPESGLILGPTLQA